MGIRDLSDDEFDDGLDEIFTEVKTQHAHIEIKPDLSFTAHEDAMSNGCVNCGNEYKSLNEDGYCSSCWTVWKS